MMSTQQRPGFRARACLIACTLLASIHGVWSSSPLQLDFDTSPRSLQATSQQLSARSLKALIVDMYGVEAGPSPIIDFTVTATLGTPPQTAQFIVDTGSSDLNVVSSHNPICNTSTPCDTGSFNQNSSSTFKNLGKNFTIAYGDGTQGSGDYVTDDFTIGGTTIENLQFGLNTEGTGYENILGMGYIDLEVSTKQYANLPYRLFTQGLSSIIGYSIWWEGPNSRTGKLAFGGVDTGKFNGTLQTLPTLVDSSDQLVHDYVTFQMSQASVTFNGITTNFTGSSITVVADSGTTALYLPDALFTQVYKSLGAVYDSSVGYPVQEYPTLKNGSTIDLTFGSAIIHIPLSQLLYPYNDTYAAIFLGSSQDLGINILGVPLFRNAYVVFDYSHNQVSLAPVVYSDVSNVTTINQNGVAGLTSTAISATPSGSSGGGGLSSGAKIGIGVGVGLGAALLLGLLAAWFFLRRRKRRTRAMEAAKAGPDSGQFGKAELPATTAAAAAHKNEKPDVAADSNNKAPQLELEGQNEPHKSELEAERPQQPPAELLGSVPEPQEMATPHDVPQISSAQGSAENSTTLHDSTERTLSGTSDTSAIRRKPIPGTKP